MRLAVHRDLLRQALELSLLAVSRDTGTINSCVVFSRSGQSDQEVLLLSTDGKFYTRVPLGVQDLHGSASFAIEAQRLSKWLDNVEGDSVSFEVGSEVTAVCGPAKAHFVAMDSSSFPTFQDGGQPLFSGAMDPFTGGLRFIQAAIGKETTNNEMANKFQIAEIDSGGFFASDTQVIAMYSMEGIDSLGGKIKIGRDELPKLYKFLRKASVHSFTVERSSSFYFFQGDDESVFGFAIPKGDLISVSGLTYDLSESEVWTCVNSDWLTALAALDAVSSGEDEEVTVFFGGCPEGEQHDALLQMASVTGNSTSRTTVPVERTRASEASNLTFKCHLGWVRSALSKFSSEPLDIGLQVEGRAKYMKIRQADDALGVVRVMYVMLKK